ncbi:O-antigen ligase family protein [Sphingomonas sp. LB-2]|uniref:O-antigen ligase family protein n=1 Tax=Sphingomonas caeni TaxID=2984949 RepID=UPI00222F9267|nr:O-antigen ligase family protein [Sphingomonas caeni]MCW3848503.1 O-antigen ligase family protein [Sphingomonas caeni]
MPVSGLGSALMPLVLLVLAFAFGGGSAGQPVRDMIVELFAILVLLAAALGWFGRGLSPDARIPLILIGLLTALFLFQLTPLPHGVWAALGGREVGDSVLGLIGEAQGMRPLSVQPEHTVLSALAVLPGVAMGIAAMRLGTPARLALAWSLVAFALASLLLGAVQVSLGSQAQTLTFYKTSHLGLPIGVFANTNHQADLLLIGIVMAGVLAPTLSGPSARTWRWLAWGVMALLAVGVVATGSRAGIALMGVGLIAVVARERLTGHVRLFLLGVAGLGGALALLIAFNPVFARSFADFANVDDPRFHFWPNVLYAIGHFGWLGTGAGTFDGVYRSVETLDTLSSAYVNHAHNDYLEILLEMGIPGILLLIAFVGFLVWRGIAVVRRTDIRLSLNLAYAAMVCAGLLLLHSAVDYPLRTPLLGVVFGLCCALMTRPPREDAEAANKTQTNPV